MIALLCLGGALAACAAATAPPPPAIEDAEALLEEIVQAGLAREWERLCANASGTCESELRGNEDRAPTEAPRVVATEVITGSSAGGVSSASGVLFVLCGVDGQGRPYESEVLVFDEGSRLLATAAVYWTGMRVGVGRPPTTVGAEGPARC